MSDGTNDGFDPEFSKLYAYVVEGDRPVHLKLAETRWLLSLTPTREVTLRTEPAQPAQRSSVTAGAHAHGHVMPCDVRDSADSECYPLIRGPNVLDPRPCATQR